MVKYINDLEHQLSQIKNGFKKIENMAIFDYENSERNEIKNFSFLCYESAVHQVRMYAVFLFGYLSEDDDVMDFMREVVSTDEDWRVQEILAKSFDFHCKRAGYENSLDIIDDWLDDENENVRRAVTEGLRIWTSREYFKDNPKEAIRRLSALKEDESEYVRKSVGNAIRDISKKHGDLVKEELLSWKLNNKRIRQVYKTAARFTGLLVSI